MTNLCEVEYHLHEDEDEGTTYWRPFGDVVSGLTARIEAQRSGVPRADEPAFVPVAWAAE